MCKSYVEKAYACEIPLQLWQILLQNIVAKAALLCVNKACGSFVII